MNQNNQISPIPSQADEYKATFDELRILITEDLIKRYNAFCGNGRFKEYKLNYFELMGFTDRRYFAIQPEEYQQNIQRTIVRINAVINNSDSKSAILDEITKLVMALEQTRDTLFGKVEAYRTSTMNRIMRGPRHTAEG